MSLSALGLGLALGLALAYLLTQVSVFRSRKFAALSLIIIAAFYPAFAQYHGKSDLLAFHGLIFCAFLALCFFGKRYWALVLGTGILAHGLFDAALHFSARLSAFHVGPDWWPEFCALVDIPVGFALIYSSTKSRNETHST